MEIKKLTAYDVIEMGGGKGCVSCADREADQQYDGDWLCGHCATSAKQQDQQQDRK